MIKRLFQVELWKKYIAFEKSNPLRSEDTSLVTKRVMFATEQCLLVLTHHPAVWHQAAQYLDQSSKLLMEKGVRIIILTFLKNNYFSTTNYLEIRIGILSTNRCNQFNFCKLTNIEFVNKRIFLILLIF